MTAGIALPATAQQPAASPPRSRWWRWTLRVVTALAGVLIFSAPWWGPPLLARLDYFRVARVEFEGVRYIDTSELMKQLALDSTASIWDDLDRYATRVSRHALVLSADVTRHLPGILVVTIVERAPVALLSTNGALVPIDLNGRRLPIDPTQKPVDAPILATPDAAMLRFLDALRTSSPRMYARVVEMRRAGRDDVVIELKGIRVRARDDVTVERFEDILQVEASLAQQNQRVVELDLRFQDQVIARLP